ncbi:tetratricopeptide repeat protein [Flavobacterium azooxidireducens]|uniref:Tetratricopeptide repeat protein n=1 Tax=Flavobacterium azooxidireducens TaxID=1871076 RepID=A0ABY4KKF6_9FLAO|nr:tetratricopeptide repeat protein [Flavobacterium azooxidireducens]UPQ80786.1 tetratricopeptide repeat protein [Flavobacterium azooxidireducens]
MENEELLNKYFEQRLSDEEKVVFESLLQNDSEFAKEVAYQKNVKKAITLNERETLKQTLQSFESNKNQPKKTYQFWSIAAVFLLFFGGLAWFQFMQDSPEKLYKEYYQSYPNVVAPAVRGDNDRNIKSDAFYEYDSGNYQKSLELFSKIYADEEVDYALFYQAMSLIELKRYPEAIALFETFETSDQNAFSPFVKWYKALSYLKTNEKEKAIQLLKELSEKENPQQQMAKNLLAELE